ncbi:MAG: hypothetical protein M3068_11155 [Gemmatimonadota bacterium]|nr:hypothetical protein [Gemmatimonadota bacterium]
MRSDVRLVTTDTVGPHDLTTVTNAPPPDASAPQRPSGRHPAVTGSHAAVRGDRRDLRERQSLPPDLQEFLLNLAVALQRHAIYPRGHPQLITAVDTLIRPLSVILAARETLALGIARDQLVIEGVATDPANSLLREMAQRLHRHHLGALRLMPGITREELSDLLLALAVDPVIAEKQLVPIKVQLERWPHARLYTLLFERLEILSPDADQGQISVRGMRVWGALARVALTVDQSDEEAGALEPGSVAEAIERRSNDPAFMRTVMGTIVAAGEELAASGGAGQTSLRQQVSQMIRTIKPETLKRLLSLGGDTEQRRKLVLDSTHGLAVDAVMTLLNAAAEASNHTISHSLLRLFGKLALQAEQGGAMLRAGSDMALRERVQQLAEGWAMEELTPQNYRQALDRMSRLRLFALMQEREHPCEPKRLLMTGIETDTLGPAVWRAVHDMETHRDVAALLDTIVRAPENNAVAQALWEHVGTKDNFRELLHDPQLDFDLLERVVGRMGVEVVDLLLSSLELADTRTARRKLMDLLAGFGDPIAPAIVSRITPERPWYVQRNLLALLNLMTRSPDGFNPSRHLAHRDARVRREALKLMLRMPAFREAGIIAGISDSDERISQMALLAAQESCPRAAVPLITGLVDSKRLPALHCTLGIKAVAAAGGASALDWLLGLVLVRKGKWLLARTRLTAKSPEMLAALAALASHWPEDRRAREALMLARGSGDLQIQQAADATRAAQSRIADLPRKGA